MLDSLARRDAADNLRELEQLPSGAFVPPSARANAYAAVGKWAQVFHWLDEALREKDMLLMQITCNRDYDPVRGDPRFIAMMREIGLPVTTAAPPR